MSQQSTRSPSPPGGGVALRAGPLTLRFERGSLRWIRVGAQEILRGIYVGVRDAHWRTIPPSVRDVQIEAKDDSFRVNFAAHHHHLDLDFLWNGTIVGDREGTLTFTMDGVAQRSFLKNRIGFCVLHPTDACAGRACTVEHVDGHIASTSFPALVSPHQAFMDIRALAHEVMPGVIAEVRVDGEIFETEDQRNWSDTSFKTYSTPVDLPFPVEVAAGTRITQEVRLRLRGQSPGVAAGVEIDTVDDIVRIETTGATVALPRIGLMLDATRPLGTRECELLRRIAPSYVRVDLDLAAADSEWRAMLTNAATQASSLGARLQVAALVSSPADAGAQLAALASAAEAAQAQVDTWLVFDRTTGTTPASLIFRARETLGAHRPVRLGGGSDKHFADLNRNRPPEGALDLLCFGSTPQAHADDVETMVENVGSVAAVIETARAFGGRHVAIEISPVTLKNRARPGAATPPPLGALPDHIDARQSSGFTAAWTIAHLRACADAGVSGVTYFRTIGPDGVMSMENGAPFPVYHALADVANGGGDNRVVTTRSSRPTHVEALCIEREGGTRRRLLLVNLRAEPQRVQLPAMLAGSASPVELDAHAIVRLDFDK
jgi:hypothetical protein